MRLIDFRYPIILAMILGVISNVFADDSATKLYDSQRVSKIEVTIEPHLWDKLRLQKRDFSDAIVDPSSSPFEYVQGSLRIDGLEIPNVAISKKGYLGSLDDDFPSLKIDVDRYVVQAPLGETNRLTLNNNKQDTSLLSQFLAYRFFNQVGVPAPQVGFASVFVNGKHLGVYSVVESVKKPFLKSRFGSENGDLVEGTLADFSKKSILRMEHKSGENKSSEKWRVNLLAELLEEDELDLKKLEQLIDMKSFYRFWATESLLAFWDGYNANQNNFFVYDNPTTGRLHFLPWGADALWSSMAGPFGGFSRTNQSVYTNSLLSHALFKSETGQQEYRRTLRDLLDKHWDEEALTAKIDELAKLIEPHLHGRQRGAAQAQLEMKRFIKTRRQAVERELENWPVTIAEKPRTPTHTEEVGVVSGEFATFWQRNPQGKESSHKLSLKIADELIELNGVKVVARRFSMGWMNFGAGAESMPPIVEFTGENSQGERYVLTVSFDNQEFVQSASNEKKSVRIRGSVNKPGQRGSGWPMGGRNMRFLQGTCELDEAATTPGAPVSGRFEAKVVRLVGGFFGG